MSDKDEPLPWISWRPGEEENDWEGAKTVQSEEDKLQLRILELEEKVVELEARIWELEHPRRVPRGPTYIDRRHPIVCSEPDAYEDHNEDPSDPYRQ